MFLDIDQQKEELTLWENRLIKSCTICNGEGSVPAEGGVRKSCSCRLKAKINAYLVSCGFPRKYVGDDWTWDTVTKKPFVIKCKDYSDDFVGNYYKGRGLYIYGSMGIGKSTMEVLIGRDVVGKVNPDTGKPFTAVFSIYDDLVKMSFDSNKKALLDRLVERTHLLIIDNIGSETGLTTENRSSVKLLENILRKRDNAGYPTIISSNFHINELAKVYNDAVHDFVKKNCEIVSVAGTNHRKKDEEDIDI